MIKNCTNLTLEKILDKLMQSITSISQEEIETIERVSELMMITGFSELELFEIAKMKNVSISELYLFKPFLLFGYTFDQFSIDLIQPGVYEYMREGGVLLCN